METKLSKNERSAAATALGKRGGTILFRKRGKAYMKKLGKRAAKARWPKNKK